MQRSGWKENGLMNVGERRIFQRTTVVAVLTVVYWLPQKPCHTERTMWCLADQNECVLAPSEPKEFSLYVHNLQNVERRGQEGCAISEPVHHHHDSLITGVKHRGCNTRSVPSSHISTRLIAVEIEGPVQTERKDPGAGVSVSPPSPPSGTSALHLCVFVVFIALNLAQEVRGAYSSVQCWYVRRPTSSSLYLILFKLHLLKQFHFSFSTLFLFFSIDSHIS